jgi:hypothetical protein
MQVHRQGQAQRERPHRPVEATLGQHWRVDTTDEGAQLGQGLPARRAGLGEQGESQIRVVPEHLLSEPDVHAQGDQPRLRPIVQVTLDPAQLRRGGVHRLGAGLGQPAHLRGHRLPGGGQQRCGGPGVCSQQQRSGHDTEWQQTQKEHLPPETRRGRAPPAEEQLSAVGQHRPYARDHHEHGQ